VQGGELVIEEPDPPVTVFAHRKQAVGGNTEPHRDEWFERFVMLLVGGDKEPAVVSIIAGVLHPLTNGKGLAPALDTLKVAHRLDVVG